MVVSLFYIATELAFITFVAEPRYWKREGKSGVVYAPSEAELALQLDFVTRDWPFELEDPRRAGSLELKSWPNTESAL